MANQAYSGGCQCGAVRFKVEADLDQVITCNCSRCHPLGMVLGFAPQSAFELVPILFKRKLDLHQMTFAMGESLAHLHALWFRGRLERHIGADGVIRFSSR